MPVWVMSEADKHSLILSLPSLAQLATVYGPQQRSDSRIGGPNLDRAIKLQNPGPCMNRSSIFILSVRQIQSLCLITCARPLRLSLKNFQCGYKEDAGHRLCSCINSLEVVLVIGVRNSRFEGGAPRGLRPALSLGTMVKPE